MPLDSNLQDEIIEWMYGFEATKDDKKNCKLKMNKVMDGKEILNFKIIQQLL